MRGSLIYGAVGGLTFGALYSSAPTSVLALAIAAVGVHMAWGARLCWRRTGLPLTSSAIAFGALVMGIAAVCTAGGHRFFLDWPPGWLGAAIVAWGGGMSCILAEPRVHPREWAAWKRYMSDMSALDILLGRHFPDLRRIDDSRVS